MSSSTLKWLEDWYKSNCNEDWEHDYGISIKTLDNPGWYITIALNDTPLANEVMEHNLTEKDEHDWTAISVKDSKFIAAGDPTKLEFLLNEFRKFVEERTGGKQE